MEPFLLASALAVLVTTALLVRRLISPRPVVSTGALTALAVAVSTAALVTAARGAVALSVTLAVLGVASVLVAVLGTSEHLR